MKEAMKHNFLESDQKTARPESSNLHIPSCKRSLQARPCRALLFLAQREMLTMALPLGFVLGTVPFNILINYLGGEGKL